MNKTNYILPKLPFQTSDLEPIISKEIIELHYHKHHQGYVNKLNEALDKYHEAELKNDIETLVEVQKDIKFNGGGHINHTFFWNNLASLNTKNNPSNNFLKILENDFESFDKFKENFEKIALSIQGSGWAWLGFKKESKKLEIMSTSNHDTPQLYGITPVMVVDLWEHAYYLQYKNEKNEFLKKIWGIINFEEVEKRYFK